MQIDTQYIILVPVLLQIFGLSFAIWSDPYIGKGQKKTLLSIMALVSCLVIQNVANYLLATKYNMPYARTVVDIIGYWIRPLILMALLVPNKHAKEFIVGWILIAINTLVYFTAFFSGIAFSISEEGAFLRGPLGYTSHIISLILLIYILFLALQRFRSEDRVDNAIPIISAITIVLAVAADSFLTYMPYPLDFLTITVASACVFCYIWLHFHLVQEYERAEQAERRIQIMMSQIQPHFLYNTLSTIQSLCRINPEKAAEVTERFGTYLRQNLDALNTTNLVNIEKEIEHSKVYSDIEKVRFPKIEVIYDIGDTNFSVPALSVQPLVENAIRHGVRGKEEGLVSVSTHDAGDFHEIKVYDNGVGFDVEAKRHEDVSNHIGLTNVKERIEKMTGGTLVADSVIGEWTTVTIRIPKGRTE